MYNTVNLIIGLSVVGGFAVGQMVEFCRSRYKQFWVNDRKRTLMTLKMVQNGEKKLDQIATDVVHEKMKVAKIATDMEEKLHQKIDKTVKDIRDVHSEITSHVDTETGRYKTFSGIFRDENIYETEEEEDKEEAEEEKKLNIKNKKAKIARDNAPEILPMPKGMKTVNVCIKDIKEPVPWKSGMMCACTACSRLDEELQIVDVYDTKTGRYGPKVLNTIGPCPWPLNNHPPDLVDLRSHNYTGQPLNDNEIQTYREKFLEKKNEIEVKKERENTEFKIKQPFEFSRPPVSVNPPAIVKDTVLNDWNTIEK